MAKEFKYNFINLPYLNKDSINNTKVAICTA